MIITLQFPKGEFTHTELAQVNGKTNQQVWTAYQAAIKAGTIVSAGLRPNASGKGKPSKIWKVADGVPVPLVDKVEPVAAVEVVKPAEAVKPVEAPFEVEMGTPVVSAPLETIVEPLPTVVPAAAPVAETVEVVEVVPPVPAVRNLTCQVTETDQLCPFCQTKLLSIDTDGGVKVWCPVNDLKICSCSENPYGVSNTIKNAVEVLHDKFFKHRPTK